MKNILLALAAVTLVFSSFIKPPKKATVSFKVEAACEMCKERIENAVDVKYVSKASYNMETELLTVTYNPRKMEEIQLHNLVAGVGHATEKVAASELAYSNLPDCCKYKDGKKCAH